MRCHCKHFHLLNSVVKRGLAFQMQIYFCKCVVHNMCLPLRSNLRLQIPLAVHVCGLCRNNMITKTCRFARAASASTFK